MIVDGNHVMRCHKDIIP